MAKANITLRHNFTAANFMWLYAKYSCGVNPQKHCANAIIGKYSKKFSRHNPNFATEKQVVFDEYPDFCWDAVYICGVSKKGYSAHKNYSHNVHVAIIPLEGFSDSYDFECWHMEVENGRFEYVISEDDLDEKYKSLPVEFTSCRMFRWAIWHYQSSKT